ncbi:MAG TPA: ankyrin repeat domain-containing protein [Abditibacteriaceae bacterium]|jgi:hypothetical protein
MNKIFVVAAAFMASSAFPSLAQAQGVGGVTAAAKGVTSGVRGPRLETAIPPATTNAATSASASGTGTTWNLTSKERAQMQLDLDMMNAAFRGETWNVRNLIAKGAKVNSADYMYGYSPLMWASQNGHLGTVRYLLSKGANPNARSKTGITFVLASERKLIGDVEVVETAEGAMWRQWYRQNGWITLQGGVTPLVIAATGGYNLTVRELLAKGANPNQTTADGETALASAAFSTNLPTVKALLDKGADVNAVDDYNQTALFTAAYSGSEHVVRELLRRGARANIVSNRQRTKPSGMAKMMGYTRIAKLLSDTEAREMRIAALAAKKASRPAAKKATVQDTGITILN